MVSDEKTAYMVKGFETAIERDPNDFRPYYKMGGWWYVTREYSKALQLYNSALELEPNAPDVLNARATLLAMCPDATIRDGDAAVRDAERAVEIARKAGGFDGSLKERRYLQTVAAAYAEVGNFEKAVRFQSDALLLAIANRVRKPMQNRLVLYKSGKAARQE